MTLIRGVTHTSWWQTGGYLSDSSVMGYGFLWLPWSVRSGFYGCDKGHSITPSLRWWEDTSSHLWPLTSDLTQCSTPGPVSSVRPPVNVILMLDHNPACVCFPNVRIKSKAPFKPNAIRNQKSISQFVWFMSDDSMTMSLHTHTSSLPLIIHNEGLNSTTSDKTQTSPQTPLWNVKPGHNTTPNPVNPPPPPQKTSLGSPHQK